MPRGRFLVLAAASLALTGLSLQEPEKGPDRRLVEMAPDSSSRTFTAALEWVWSGVVRELRHVGRHEAFEHRPDD